LREQKSGFEETGGMLMDALEALRDEYRQLGVGETLHELLGKVVWSTVRQYPPSEYSPYGAWDQPACEDVLNDWITERLWGRGDLQKLLSSSATIQHLRAALTTSLRQHLTNRRRRSIAANLFKRIQAMLRTDSAFRRVSSMSTGSEERFALANDGVPSGTSGSRADLLQIASELTDDDLEVVRYGPFAQKLSPILRDPKLREFLLHLFRRAGTGLALKEIIEVMRFRFSLPTEEVVELDEGLPTLKDNPAHEAMILSGARGVISQLTLDEANILESYFRAGGVFSDAARLSGCDVQRVRDGVHHAFAMICEYSDSEDEARTLMTTVESLLIQHGDR
jgi:hypothetical protein